ncbi:MAG: thioredoxin-dependent thiol peroxidase [Anaerolineae bacterium]|nr:thioredoxin-dependent thiol peroxidase [Anaerolineae bacterium]
MPKPGQAAPDFELPSDRGDKVRLSDFRGKKVVLYFYPKDMTSGCTKEACSFRDNYPQYEEQGAVILGVSPDPPQSHVRFKSKYNLPFLLLSDEDHKVAEQYGVWGEKQMYGRAYQGILRTTFVIDEQGRIAKVFTKVKPDGHGEEVLGALAE